MFFFGWGEDMCGFTFFGGILSFETYSGTKVTFILGKFLDFAKRMQPTTVLNEITFCL